jgi:Domain of unknown function (DUF3291)
VTAREWQLAQVNIAEPLEPLDSARLREFMDLLAPINALADAAPGFVWRLQTEDGNATAVQVFDDPALIVNMSVWESVETLNDFVFGGEHVRVMRRRVEWFVRMRAAYTALWWVPAGTLPTVPEAEQRLVALRENGPTAYAFSFKRPFPAPDTDSSTSLSSEPL